MVLDKRFVNIEKAENSTFDYWLRISTLNKGKRILLPFRNYDYAKDYFENWKLVNGARLKKEGQKWFLCLTFEKQEPKIKEQGKQIGVDIGVKKLLTTSERRYYGKNIESLMDKIQRKQQGSKAFNRALIERNQYINRIVKQLPYHRIKTIILENIKNIFRNSKKEKKLSKVVRSKFQRWVYSFLLKRIAQLTQLNGVRLVLVNPAYTSQTCSECSGVHKLNRIKELFKCRNCGYTCDADYNTSKNILNFYLAQQNTFAGRKEGLLIL